MLRTLAACLVLGFTAACSEPAAPTTAAPPLTSGFDAATFDAATRPQDDLYRYVNGGWLATTEIPADKASYGGFVAAHDRTQEQLRTLVETAAKATPARGTPQQKIGDFFTAFMDEAKADQLGITPLASEFARIDAIATRRDLAAYFARQLKLGVGGTVIQGGVEGDAQEPTRSVLYVSQGGIGLPDRDYYLKPDPKLQDIRAKYVAYVAQMLDAAGVKNTKAAAAGVMALETSLARAHWTNVENRDAVKTYNRVPMKELATRFPGMDWAAWTAELGVSDAPHIIVSQPSFFAALAKTVGATPVEQWKAHLKFHAVDRFAPYLSSALVNARFDFRGKTLQGIETLQPRWRRALTGMDSTLGELLGQVYVEVHFSPTAKARMDQLVENLRSAFRQGIDALEWMGPETKKEAQAKLAAFRPKIGYPTKWRDYSAVEIRQDDLAGNMLRAIEADAAFQLAKVGKDVDPEEWGMTPQTINAYYNPIRNEIVFPAAILQPPFFDMGADDAMNYGAIGAVIGHEMGHGFDDQGRRFDAAGVLRDWWTEKDGDEFMRRATGLSAYYGAMEPIPGVKVNGDLTLGENIGDLTGLVIAHRAYRMSLGGKDAPVMDGLTGDQRFFAGWAQAWRAKIRDEALRNQVLADPHAPDQVRGNGPLPHVAAFYTAFDVKPADKLYLAPEARVTIW
ncbi:MAG: M13 family metallopeptidase [Acidobacteria bacterium]|nr:M13 family metallopeptidase [Acidobacteriota bacterium]